MNLRKDHYRSFTRTLRIVVVLSLLLARQPWLLRHAPCLGRLVLVRLTLCGQWFRLPPREAFTRLSPVSHKYTTLVDGYLGMNNDEERSEMRYVVRIAEFSESSKL